MDDSRIPTNLLSEEYDVSRFMRLTMSSAAVNKDQDEFEAFCTKLIDLPYKKRFAFAFDFFESINGYPKIEPKSMKSSVEALKFKNLGNTAFMRGDSIEALKLYTKSVAVAPVGSPDLAVAFGNRSAALFELQRYEACMVDINRALKENCPETSRPKLVDRKEKCRSKLIELRAAEIDPQKSMKKLSLDGKKCETKKDRPIDEDALDLDYSGKFPLPETNLKNKRISNASEKVIITSTPTLGRHVVAVQDIEIGEFIGVEKPYASVLFKICQYSHCAHCFVRCEALIPCPDCSAVMYCNRRCREDDYNRSHRIECQIYFYSHSLGLPLPSSLRLAIQTMMVLTKQGEKLEELMKDPHFKNPMKSASNLVPEKLDTQDCCARHFRTLRNDTRLFAYPYNEFSLSEAALSLYRVIIIGHVLRQTSYFDSIRVKKTQVDKHLTAERKYVGLLFLKLMISLPTYTLAVQEIHQKEVDDIMLHTISAPPSVGTGFYLFHAIFNHSCYVNVTMSHYNDTIVSQAVQPIKAGQQLFVCYGPNFLLDRRIQRREDLRKGYQFECFCEACVGNWPTFFEMTRENVSLANCKITQPQWQYFKKELEKFYNNPVPIIEYNTHLFDFFRRSLTLFHRNFKKPIPDQLFIFLAFQTLLQSRGNNYVYTRDNLLMSL